MGVFMNCWLVVTNRKPEAHPLAATGSEKPGDLQIRRERFGSDPDSGTKVRLCAIFGRGGTDESDKARRHQCDPASQGRWFPDNGRGKQIHLTELGREVAESIYERHCILKEGLIYLGVDKETAEQDACRIEHDISRETFEKLKACWEKIAKGERKP